MPLLLSCCLVHLAKLESVAEIIIYTTVPCPYCSRAKALLKARDLEYTEFNLASDPDGRVKLAEKTGMMTFPQILIDDKLIGGWDQLSAADADGSLAAILDA